MKKNILIFLSLLCLLSQAQKVDYKILFSNDYSNLIRTPSPFYEEGKPFTDDVIKASIDETVKADCDVHFLETITYIPNWQSDIYPIKEHVKWFMDNYDGTLDPFAKYMYEGGDMVKTFTEHCRQSGIAPFVSFRMNDWHGMLYLEAPKTVQLPDYASFTVDKFRKEHPEYWMSKPSERALIPPEALKARDYHQYLRQAKLDSRMREEHIMNWKYPAVRMRVLSFIKEVCSKYDVEGIQLDFMRYIKCFRTDDTTQVQRRAIITDFVRKVRKILDETSTAGNRRKLCLRLPAFIVCCKERGFDVEVLSKAGVDMFNLSNSYYSVQQSDIEQVSELASESSCYLEMTYCLAVGDMRRGRRFTTPEQIQTTANLVYNRGGAGLSFFNMAYYRPYANTEPPFSTISTLTDMKRLAVLPQQYFLCRGWNNYLKILKVYPDNINNILINPLNRRMSKSLVIDMSLPVDWLERKSCLRVQSAEPFNDGQILSITMNGKQLELLKDAGGFFENPYAGMASDAGTWRAWDVPAVLLKSGENIVEIGLESGQTIAITYLDVEIE